MDATYRQELEMAKRVQEGLLSVKSPDVEGIRIAKRCIPAESVGGDFYTFGSSISNSTEQKSKLPGVIEYTDSREALLSAVIGDVAGHGVSSALVMALSSGILTEISKNTKSPSEALRLANNTLLTYIENSQIRYVTACYVVFHVWSKRLSWASAGHPAPILVRPKEPLKELSGSGLILGMYPNETYTDGHIYVQPNDKIVLYTDGLTETRNSKGELFGIDRLKWCLETHTNLNADDLLEEVFIAIHHFSENQRLTDDQTLVILEAL